MEVNADFAQRAVSHAAPDEWTPSPMPGVERRMLDRIGDEVARATTLVRFAPGSAFSAHTHGGGEEYLVLEGVFEDETGAFPVGSYVRNPPTSHHTPASSAGVTIFVKLWQFDPDDRETVRIDTAAAAATPVSGRPGVSLIPLFEDERENVRMEVWSPGADVSFDVPGGMEALVVEGGFEERGELFSRHSWLRLPKGDRLTAKAGPTGARVWIKTGHLTAPPTAPAA